MPGFVSPNGDGHTDITTLTMGSDEPLRGTARLLDAAGHTVRLWTFTAATARSWAFDGRDAAGRTLPDGRYTLRLGGYDGAGNPSVAQAIVGVDRTIRTVTWSSPSFRPAAGGKDRVTVALRRPANVSVSVYLGTTLVRRMSFRAAVAGTYGWTWDGRTSTGAVAGPGTYKAVVAATSWVGWSSYTKSVVVRAK